MKIQAIGVIPPSVPSSRVYPTMLSANSNCDGNCGGKKGLNIISQQSDIAAHPSLGAKLNILA